MPTTTPTTIPPAVPTTIPTTIPTTVPTTIPLAISSAVPAAAAQTLPTASQPFNPAPKRRRRTLLLVLLLAGIGGGGAFWWQHTRPILPPGIAFSNGRLEADEIDIATKFAGRIDRVLADEGDHVRAGQVVATIDTRDLQASLAAAEAQIDQARHTIAQSQAELVSDGTQLKLAAQELARARQLVAKDFETREVLDQRQAGFDAATAAYHGTEAKIAAATAAMQAAIHSAELIRVNIADNVLVAPKSGPIQYRLANVGEVLPAGGKVFTMLDETDVYMDIFLPSPAAGKVRLGDEARIVLESGNEPIPATVGFIASENQFTPKMVETKQERDKLMFRVRIRIDPAWLKSAAAGAPAGQPGLGYIQLDPQTPWPDALRTPAPVASDPAS